MKAIFSKRALIVAFFLFTLLFAFCTEMGFYDKFRISIGSLFGGLLALTGFLFTARTFITFKLNEVIYGNPNYRGLIEQLRKEGAYDKELYDPLKKLDSNLGTTSYMSLTALLLVLVLGFFPDYKNVILPKGFSPNYLSEFVFSKVGWTSLWQNNLILPVLVYKVYSSITLGFLVVTGLKIFQCISSVNQNIGAIIEHWEDEYKRQKENGGDES
jgi:hypothetical protein